jgi:hypothetical protein
MGNASVRKAESRGVRGKENPPGKKEGRQSDSRPQPPALIAATENVSSCP